MKQERISDSVWLVYRLLAAGVMIAGVANTGAVVVRGYVLPNETPLVLSELMTGAAMWTYFYWIKYGKNH